jgi:hypothetical protein
LETVIENFKKQAAILIRQMEKDGYDGKA